MGYQKLGEQNKLLKPKQPGPDSEGCSCLESSFFQLPHALYLAIVRSVAPTLWKRPTTEDDIHETLIAVVDAMLTSEEASLEHTTQAGDVMLVVFSQWEKAEDDLSVRLSLRMNDSEVFSGSLTVYGAFCRGRVALVHSLGGAIEFLYHHIWQRIDLRKAEETHMSLGTLDVRGTVSNTDTIVRVLSGAIQRSGSERLPGFDRATPFGAFPVTGYEHYVGDRTELLDSPLVFPE